MGKEKTVKTTIEDYKNTAFEVYSFITDLPEHLARFVFKRIVSEAYDTAKCYPVDEVIPQLAFSVSSYYNTAVDNPDNDPEKVRQAKLHLANYLGLDVYTMERVVRDTEMLTRTLLSSRWDRLPDPENLVKSFLCFSYKEMPCDIRNIDIWERLDDIIIESETADYAAEFYNKNCFYQMGYITGLFNDRLDDIDKMAFHWYCKGHIMDAVFGCIWDNPNIQVSCILYKHLLDACTNKDFSHITKTRYDIIRKTKPGWPEALFLPVTAGKKALVKGFGLLPLRSDKEYQQKCQPFFEFSIKLQEKGYIVCSCERFIDIFTKNNDVTPIEWRGDAQSLAAFANIIYFNTSVKTIYKRVQSKWYNAVHECIYIEKGNAYNTLKTYFNSCRDEDKKLFLGLITDCGIKE